MCIKVHGARRDLKVFDPFLGIGNSWTAAIRTNAGHFYGCDLDPIYIAEAKRRIKIQTDKNESDQDQTQI
jgi:DNA modification methylase